MVYVVDPGQPALGEIAARFGPGILQQGGSLGRTELRERVFRDADQRRWLEALLHPLVYVRYSALMRMYS